MPSLDLGKFHAVARELAQLGVPDVDPQHLTAWLSRWADAYSTDTARAEAYAEHQRQLIVLTGSNDEQSADGPRSNRDPLCEALAARIANASSAFPSTGYACFAEADGNHIAVTATCRDAHGQLTVRKFAAELRESR